MGKRPTVSEETPATSRSTMVASTVVLVSPDRVVYTASNYVAPKEVTCWLNHIQALSAHPVCTPMLNLQVVYSLGEMPALTFSQMRCFTAGLVPQAAPVYTARTVADFQLKLESRKVFAKAKTVACSNDYFRIWSRRPF